jgi:hypothetical protein
MDANLAPALISLVGLAAFTSRYLAGRQRRKRALTEVKAGAAQGDPIHKPRSGAAHQ